MLALMAGMEKEESRMRMEDKERERVARLRAERERDRMDFNLSKREDAEKARMLHDKVRVRPVRVRVAYRDAPGACQFTRRGCDMAGQIRQRAIEAEEEGSFGEVSQAGSECMSKGSAARGW